MKNKEWKKTDSENILENDQWYEIGHLNQFQGNFVHQGIRKYDNGFMDDNNYHLKPFPTHLKKIVLSQPYIE